MSKAPRSWLPLLLLVAMVVTGLMLPRHNHSWALTVVFLVTTLLLFGWVYYQQKAFAAANRQLQASESHYRSLLELAPEAVVLADASGTIRYVNQRTMDLFRGNFDDFVGQQVELLIPEHLHQRHRHSRSQFAKTPKLRDMGSGLELKGRRLDGEEFPIDVMLSPMDRDGDLHVMAMVRDVSDKKAAEHLIKVSLAEKDVLLKEVYHRVKNNMQVIASLMRMQARSAKNDEVRAGLTDAASRVRAMALVHEKLYQSKSLSQVSFDIYADSLIDDLQSTFGREGIKVKTELAKLELHPEVLIPLGLIINELIANSYKHGLSESEEGLITLLFAKQGEQYRLTLQDSGKGLPANFSPQSSRSLGMKLVTTLVAQLQGELTWHNDNGACFEVLIPADQLPQASPMQRQYSG
ncbi:sensor histidine kinase [Gallaecimonas mangrovi]|uniref:sensor histidine kinase n=1 Tax=Gallaecimonas mangrovi TaxID=2291597 RepID=UPI000E200E12|nr:histidine kinase dimerization/phosphoacceptor domain -containing protein [Gallaecimonas mangrovi]